jgi:hypothetical protein
VTRLAGSFGSRSRVALILVLAAIISVVWVSPGRAGTIGRAKLDGSGVEWSFIRTPSSVPPLLRFPWQLAADSAHLYWRDWVVDGIVRPPITVQRADLDGSRVRTLVSGDTLANTPFALSADGRHVYWLSPLGILRAKPDGSAVERLPIAGFGSAYDLAVAGDHIYWLSLGETNPIESVVGRARLDGSHVESALITGIGHPASLAVDGRYIYWTTNAERGYGQYPTPEALIPPFYRPSPLLRAVGLVGRASLDGSGVDRHFISGLRVTGYGIAVDRGHLYWTDMWSGHIGRARKDGSHIEKAFIRAPYGVIDVAVAHTHVYWTNPGTPPHTIGIAIRNAGATLRRDPRCGLLDPGPPRPLYRACVVNARLACPTADDWPCTGSVRLVTADPVRYRGKKRRPVLATADYTMVSETQTVELRLSKRKATLVLNNPRARTVRAIARVVAAKDVTTVTKRMRVIP